MNPEEDSGLFFFFTNTAQSNILFIYLFVYFWLIWVFVAAHGLSLVAASGGYSSLRCTGFSLRWLLLLRSTGSRRVGFSSCGTRAELLCGMWDLPGPGLEPVSPALAGGFLTTAPPGKSQDSGLYPQDTGHHGQVPSTEGKYSDLCLCWEEGGQEG